MKQTSVLLTLSTVLLAACGNGGLAPPAEALRLDATIGRPTIGTGDTTSIVFTLRNLSRAPIVLSFLTSCQVLPYITTPRADQVVYPSDGGWGCYQVLTSLALGPGAEHVTTVLVRGAQANGPAIALPPGEYRAYARLEQPDLPLRSATIEFRVE